MTGQTRVGTALSRRDAAVATPARWISTWRTDAERWGVIFALRTGPGDWNTKLVTDCKRYFRRVEDGRVLHLGRVVPCPEETDFFRAIGQPWVEPRDRSVGRVRIGPPDLASAAHPPPPS